MDLYGGIPINKYIVYIKSHCEAPDYEDSCLADSRLEAALIFSKRLAKGEDAFSAADLLDYIEEDGIISGSDAGADARDLFAKREWGNQLGQMESRNL